MHALQIKELGGPFQKKKEKKNLVVNIYAWTMQYFHNFSLKTKSVIVNKQKAS
jgi:hypothetical protein